VSAGPGGIALEHSPLPNRHAVRSTIEDLIGRDVDLADGVPPASKSTNVVAVYVTDRLATSAMCVVDLECASRIGGALGMVPRLAVDEAIHTRELSGAIRDNAHEVLNVLSAVFNVPGAPHVRLYEMYGPGDPLPADVAALGAQAINRMDVQLKVAGYGSGTLSIVVK
jgi:hypothetical protein